MGSWLSVMDCGLMHVMLGTHPEVELTPQGLQTTHEEMMRIHAEREQRILKKVTERETKCTDLEADIFDLETQALNQHKIMRNNATGTRLYNLAMGTAKRAMLAAQMKKRELVKQQKWVSIGRGILHRMSIIDSNADDHEFAEDLRQFTAALDVNEHARQLEELEVNATEAIDNAEQLSELEEKAMSGVNALEFAPVSFDESAQNDPAADHGEFLAALERLAAERDPTSSSVPVSGFDYTFPETPASSFSVDAVDNRTRRTALAMGDDGNTQAHEVGRRKPAAVAKPNTEKDYFATVF